MNYRMRQSFKVLVDPIDNLRSKIGLVVKKKNQSTSNLKKASSIFSTIESTEVINVDKKLLIVISLR